ncbi:MAG: hypothetical protein CVV45_00130 [Spirochaetae bacterium HGW-Spirochaetae-10]|nr:MAG: hypothetical protein CVV45_00130 [Spirochaetae bacterium HGW-Spirochaetae-10]
MDAFRGFVFCLLFLSFSCAHENAKFAFHSTGQVTERTDRPILIIPPVVLHSGRTLLKKQNLRIVDGNGFSSNFSEIQESLPAEVRQRVRYSQNDGQALLGKVGRSGNPAMLEHSQCVHCVRDFLRSHDADWLVVPAIDFELRKGTFIPSSQAAGSFTFCQNAEWIQGDSFILIFNRNGELMLDSRDTDLYRSNFGATSSRSVNRIQLFEVRKKAENKCDMVYQPQFQPSAYFEGINWSVISELP